MVWLTGASGYVGSHVLRRLLERGARVRCLLLPGEHIPSDLVARVDLVRGDLTTRDWLAQAGNDIDAVVHGAALMLPNPPGAITRVNVEGTANTLAFAQACSVKRFVYISAVSAIYSSLNVYGRSKAEAERLVRSSGLPYTILRPTMIYGRGGGSHFATLSSMIKRAPGIVPVLGPGTARLQPVCIDDVVDAVELALFHPAAANQAYNVGGATALSFNELVDAIAGAAGRRRVKVHIPMPLCAAAAAVLVRISAKSTLTPESLHGINQDATVDIGPFRADCGYRPRTLAEGLAREFGSAQQQQTRHENTTTRNSSPS